MVCRYVVDGNKVIILREDVDQKVDDVTFEQVRHHLEPPIWSHDVS